MGTQCNRWGHSTFELIESHGNILRYSMADFATATAKSVTENVEVAFPMLHPSVKVNFHWHKARWHAPKMPLGLSQGIVTYTLA